MDITFLGETGLKIAGRDLTIAANAKGSVKSDVRLFSTANEGSSESLVFDGPGEYEVRGAMIDGVALDGGKTAFSMVIDDIRLAYLGDMEQEALADSQLQALGAIDVLFIPLNGRKAEVTSKMVSSLEPRIVIPTDYDEASLQAFLSETGSSGEKMDKLKINRKDLPEDTQRVVVLAAKE